MQESRDAQSVAAEALRPAVLEICAGAGGQAIGLERAGFRHVGLVELDADACETLRANRPSWPVLQCDLREYKGEGVAGPRLDLLAGGVPCPPFSLAGRQLGPADPRDLFPSVLDLAGILRPRAIMIENVKGLLSPKFDAYRSGMAARLRELGYEAGWRLLNACDFGVPQLRPRAVLIALLESLHQWFRWPEASLAHGRVTVGQVLRESMAAGGWEQAAAWAGIADQVGPTVCGGSRKHGGPDLGPSGARNAWARLGINGSSLADQVPRPGDPLPVRLTTAQVALLQGFPEDWTFAGNKTSRYRQIGNAFPPPVAEAVGRSLAPVLLPGLAAAQEMPKGPDPVDRGPSGLWR
ncbi:DNA cytosine methyltransferase [Kitasatospora sp. NPDC051853]|uniref:DNA cytosine methyltransferase n=1 Tax=Kitasatospora sp. NPDC051853 TaxID=3364058 RepID=UPI00378EFB29